MMRASPSLLWLVAIPVFLLATSCTPLTIAVMPGDALTAGTVPQPSTAPTPAPTSTPIDIPTPTPEPTLEPTLAALTAAQLRAIQPNELGWVLVLEYHDIAPGEDNEYNRTPDSFRADLAWLYVNNYYPIRFRDLTSGHIDIPAGKAPVALTFDDSTIGQFRYLEDGTIDPDSAMGILLDFAETHPDFPPVATFFPLLDVPLDERVLWGQPEYADQKLQTIIELGGEVGSHTVSHERLDLVSEERARWQLAFSTKWLEERIGNGYRVISLSLPFGAYPDDESWLRSGSSEGASYAFTGAAEVAGGPAPSPYTVGFDPYHIFRAQVIPVYIEGIFDLIEGRPTMQFISDGDPNTITIPTEETLDPWLGGLFDETRWPHYQVVRYERPR